MQYYITGLQLLATGPGEIFVEGSRSILHGIRGLSASGEARPDLIGGYNLIYFLQVITMETASIAITPDETWTLA